MLKHQLSSTIKCVIMNINMCGSCIHCQLLSKWNMSALNVRTLFVVTDLFHSIGAHVKSVHAHSKINNALLHSSVCACCADRCAHLSLSKETDSTVLLLAFYSFSGTSWCREIITKTDKILAINAEILWMSLSNGFDTLIVKELSHHMDKIC